VGLRVLGESGVVSSAAHLYGGDEAGAFAHVLELRSTAECKNNYFTQMCSGSEEGSYARRIDVCITQL